MHTQTHACLSIYIHVPIMDTYICVSKICVCTYIHIIYAHACLYICINMSHRGVFRTIKSLVHALGSSSSMTEPIINSTLLTFIDQVNIYDFQKVVLQFAIHFVPVLGYTI